MREKSETKRTRDTQQLVVLNNDILREFNTHTDKWNDCRRCLIGNLSHNHVFARGTLPCDILFIGEGPGKTEDLVGYPFIGKAGKIIDRWINEAWGALFQTYSKNKQVDLCFKPRFTDVSWSISNVVLCRPCDGAGQANRCPSPDEIHNCRPRLLEFVQLAKPIALIFLGLTASKFSAPILPILEIPKERQLHLKHPAYFLRKESGMEGGTLELSEIERLKKFVCEIAQFKAKETR